ncbi:uncharacterized protein LOC124155369 [Ischnura elegans]|uniref:uncharacterized protein LOC124155369 n=1 Tax=Ischnura elegans TaxID=197161 RepID=UPI001ED89DFF|nr:uncharacterized protein LOC124155369 [Ischnura elegans]
MAPWLLMIWVMVTILNTGSQLVVEGDEVTLPPPTDGVMVHGPGDLICFIRRPTTDACIGNEHAVATNSSGIHRRIYGLYSKMSSSLRELIGQGSLATAAPQLFSELHPVIFYLMPPGDARLRAGGEALARYVRVRGGETAAITAAAALLADVDDRDLFISKLAGVNLPERSQSLLGEHLAEWFPGTDDWKFERFAKALKAGNPLVASLPPPFLTSLPAIAIERFLYLVSQWEAVGSSRADQWLSKGKAVTRTWSLMIMKSQHPHQPSHWKSLSYHRYSFLLLGFTPDELLTMSNPGHDVWSNIFQLKFDRLQARAVFGAIVGNGSALKEGDLKNGIPLYSMPLLPLLSPRQLANSFNHSAADFGALNHLPRGRFNQEPSFATALQLSHCLMSQCLSTKTSNSSDKQSGRSREMAAGLSIGFFSDEGPTLSLECFLNAGRFAYSLPLPFFRSRNISRVHPELLKDIDSDQLSIIQGRLLAKHLTFHFGDDQDQPLNQSVNGSFLLGADDFLAYGAGLVRGLLPTSSIVSLNVSQVPQKVIQHLLDVDRPSARGELKLLSLRSLAIVHKLENELSQPWVLKHILGREPPVHIFRHLSPHQLTELSKDIVANSNLITLSGLHHSTLTTLLDVVMPELLMRGPGGGRWSLEALTPRAMPLLRGLACRHLALLDPLDVVVVLAEYNKQRQEKGRVEYLPFPKNLQRCAVRALASHLELKAGLWRGENMTSLNVIQALEASDLESVGGFVLGGLPEHVLVYLGADALRLVGQLSPPELLVALHPMHHPADVALILLKQLGMASDMEMVARPVSHQQVRGVPKYSLGRLGSKWSEWRDGRKGGGAASLMPLLFGSLLQFLPPDLVDAASLKWTLETASHGGALVCLGMAERQRWYSTLVQAFGRPEQWTGSTLSTIGDFLVVVPAESLDLIAKDSWTEAVDALVENTRYFARNIQTSSGFLSYHEVCAKMLAKAEEGAYVRAVKGLARLMLDAMQRHVESVTPYEEILARVSSGRVHEAVVVPVPGLQRPPLITTVAPPNSSLIRSQRATQLAHTSGRETEEQPLSVSGTTIKVSCNAIRALDPEIVAMALNPEDIELMSPQEIGVCVHALGSAPLKRNALRMVWQKANLSDVPVELADLGKLVSVMILEDLLAFNVSIVSNLDSVSVLGQEISNWEMVDELAMQLLPSGGEALGVEAAGAMGALLCGLRPDQLPKPQVLFRVAPLVSQSLLMGVGKGCPPLHCLRALARVASSWLGKPQGKEAWTPTEVSFLGVLAAGLDGGTLESLAQSDGAENALEDLDLSAVACMPQEILKNLSGAFVSRLSQLAAMRLSEEWSAVLSEDVRLALRNVETTPFDEMELHPRGEEGPAMVAGDNEMKTESVDAPATGCRSRSGAVLVAVVHMVLLRLFHS